MLLTLSLVASLCQAAFAEDPGVPMLLVDMDTTEVLFQQDAGVPWHPASLTKLMTAYLAFEAIAAGRLSLESPVKISRNAASEAPSTSGLPVGATITLQDALFVLIVKSANDLAVAIGETVAGSEEAFVDQMNAAARRLGMTATHFENPNGLPHRDQVTTARDLAVLSLYIHRQFPQFLPIFSTETVTLGTATFETNNNLLTDFAGTTGMKTGYVCGSGLNIVATVTRNGRSLMAVVLGGTSARERGEMAAQLFLRGFAGSLEGTGMAVAALPNGSGEPVDMTPYLCGKDAKAFVAERQKAFPLGLNGQPSYLTDEIDGPSYVAAYLGRWGNVPPPRPRPPHLPSFQPPVVVAGVGGEPVDPTLVAPVPMPTIERKS